MALPKALLCLLRDGDEEKNLEADLRKTGFATATIGWKEIASQPRDWMQLLPVIEDPSVAAWVIAGKPEDFTTVIRSQIALLTLGMCRKAPPATAFILTGKGDMQDVPEAMGHIRIVQENQPFASKLMAARMRPIERPALPFFLQAHIDPLIGVWLEIAPPENETWDGFLIGVTDAQIAAFGVGPKGVIPSKTALNYPMLGITGEIGGTPFFACAAKNTLDSATSAYIKTDGNLTALLHSGYPDTQETNDEYTYIQLA